MAHARRSIDEKFASGQYYDALQMVKTLHRRLCMKGQLSEAAKLCVDNACRFIEVEKYELAVDLGKDLVASLEASKASPSDENITQIEAVLSSIPPGAATIQKYALLHQALKWSTASCTGGHPRLHRVGAMAYWAEKDFGKCQGHLVYCGDGPCLAQMVREWRECGYPNERDLFALRTLLILLSLSDLTTARTFWDAITDRPLASAVHHEVISEPSAAAEATGSAAALHSAPAPSTGEAAAPPPAAAPSPEDAASISTSHLIQMHLDTDNADEVRNSLEAVVREAFERSQQCREANQCLIVGPTTTSAQRAKPEAPGPVIACGTFLLAATEAKNLEFFRMVRGKYALVMRRDQSFDKYLDEIEIRIFGAQAQRSGLGAMLEAMMGGLNGGLTGGPSAVTTLS